jgi:hypothetical protein
MLSKRICVLAGIAFFCVSNANAEIYKCETSKGDIAFQQIPCAKGSTEEKVKVRAGPSPAEVESARARLQVANEPPTRPFGDVNNPDDNNASDPVPSQSSERTAEQSSGPCPAGQVPLNASRHDPSKGFSKSGGYVPLRCGSESRPLTNRLTRTGPGYTEPKRILDQYGNGYTQLPGSNFAIDDKTGKPCVINGSTIVSCP